MNSSSRRAAAARAAGVRALGLALCVAASAAGAATPAVSTAALEAHVRFLADDLLEGRGTGQRGHELAARYVAAQFAQYGLQPGAGAGQWLQRIPLVEAAPLLPAARASLHAPDGTLQELEYGTHFIPAVNYREPEVVVEAPLVFAGFGVLAPERAHDDFAGLDLRGRIVVVFAGAPSRFAGPERAYHASSERKLGLLVERGAVGVITIDTPEEEARVPWERRLALAWRPRMRWLDASGTPVDDYHALRARFIFSRVAAEKLFDGAAASYAQVIERATAGEAQGMPLPARARLKTVSQLRRLESANVLGLLPGSDARFAGEVIVVTAHLDHLGKGLTVGAGDVIYNGAHDNASGIATLLETARVLAAGPRLKRPVLFAAVTGEENGLIGSDVLARSGPGDGRRFVANLNMDMPTALFATRDFVAFGAEHSTLGPVAARAAAAEGYELSPDPRPEEVVFIRSDQYSFVRQGVPALYLDGGDRPVDPALDGPALVREFLQKRYHTVGDDPGVPMDYPTLAGLARVNLQVLREIGDSPRPPAWLPGDFFGQRFGPAPPRP